MFVVVSKHESLTRITNTNHDMINKALEVLESGGIIGFPTDTVYGIGCDAYNQDAIERIYKLKNRPLNKPLTLFIRDKSELEKYAYIPAIGEARLGEKLIEEFWPGELTIIFSAKPNCPTLQPLDHFNPSTLEPLTVAIRIPNYEPILTILKKYKNPLATTSANLSNSLPPITHISLQIKPNLIIPGTSKSGIPSTIINLSTPSPRGKPPRGEPFRGEPLRGEPPTIIRKGKIKIPNNFLKPLTCRIFE